MSNENTKKQEESPHTFGVWFQSSLSGLWYQNRFAAGSYDVVSVDGVKFHKSKEDQEKEYGVEEIEDLRNLA